MDPQPGTSAVSRQPPQQQPKPLSCTSCRARKLKCSREHPCQHCTRSGAECVFPTRKRIRKPRKNKNSELLQRLSRLESIVGKVGIGDLGGGGAGGAGGSTSAALDLLTANLSMSPSSSRPTLEGSQGRAVGGETREDWQRPLLESKASQYLSGEFWSSLCGEVEGLRQALEQSTDSDDDELQGATPDSAMNDNSPSTVSAMSPGMLLGSASLITYEAIQHPSPEHICYLSTIFFQNVDMILKILHRPTIYTTLHALQEAPESARSQLTPEREALLFSIYHAAVASLSPQACVANLGQRREDLIRSYAAAVEHLLVRADYLSSTSLETLQALTLYVACLRSTSGSRAPWALLSLPIRLAQALSLHREAANAHLPPYDAEMRRRLWWQLIVLDIRASEDRGTTTIVARDSYDTALPLNLDDADFGPSTSGPLVEKQGPTDMTFSLCTAQSSGIFLYVEHAQGRASSSGDSGGGGGGGGIGSEARLAPPPPQTVEETVRHAQSLEAQFVTGADPNHAASYLASVTVRLIILKLWLMMQYPLHPRQRRQSPRSPPMPSFPWSSSSLPATSNTPGDSQLPPPPPQSQGGGSSSIFPHEATLRTAVSIMELNEYLRGGRWGERMRWWADTYVQWHPLAVALAELCAPTTTRGELAERAWRTVEDVYPRWSEVIADTKSGTLWRPIRKLYKKAKAARAAAAGGGGIGTTTSSGTAVATTAALAPMITSTTAAPSTRDDIGAGADTIYVRTDNLEPTRLPEGVDAATTESESAYGMEIRKSREPSIPLDLEKLSTSPFAFSESMWAWRDLSFDIPLMDLGAGSNAMDWSTWDDFVQDTQASQSKSGSTSEMSPQ
ncbi:fungal-specific transcription factor domain-containing protein [Hypoxylon crocopeplum]|nr:fungal-specific transcription factor domain-containing protein [Hypoxylon crocopeplum]